jgi:TatA/E family protein of Tat protein translocase
MIGPGALAMLGSLGFPEMIFIGVLALLVFGPKRLPELGRTLGRGLAEFRKATNELKRSINTELALDEDLTTLATPSGRREWLMGDGPRRPQRAAPAGDTAVLDPGAETELVAETAQEAPLTPVHAVPDPRAEPRSPAAPAPAAAPEPDLNV